MNSNYLVKSLKRIYDECEKAQRRDQSRAAGGMVNRYNSLLPELKEAYPENEVIQQKEEINKPSTRGRSGPNHNEKIQDVKFESLSIADSLNLDTSDFEREPESEGMNIIHLNQNQSVTQSVSVSNLTKQVNNMMADKSDKEDLREIISEFQQEVEDDEPDESRLQDLVGRAREYSLDVSLKLAMVALQKGIDIVTKV